MTRRHSFLMIRQHQRHLYALEFFLRGFYFSVKTTLIYIMLDRGYADFSQASKFLALFSSCYFLSPLVGSVLTDKFLGVRGALFLGVILNLCAGCALQLAHSVAFYGALACLLVSGGLTKGNVICLMSEGAAHHKNSMRFVLLYATTNIAAFLLPNATGLMGESFGWPWAQMLGLLLCVPPLFLLRFDWQHVKGKLLGPLLVAAQVVALSTCFYFWEHLKGAPSLYGTVLVLGVVGTAYAIRANAATLLVMTLTALYVGFAEMIFFDLNKDILTHMDRWIGDFQVPAAWFMTARAFFIFLIGVILAKRQKTPHVFSKNWLMKRFSVSFALLGVSYLLHQTGLYLNSTFVGLSMALMACGFFLNGVAEIRAVPEAIGFVSSQASPHTHARTMGLFYGFLALGVLCAPFLNDVLLHRSPVFNFLPSATPYIHLTAALFFLSIISYTGGIFYKRVTK